MGCLKILGNVGKIFKGLNRVWTPRYLNNNDDISKKSLLFRQESTISNNVLVYIVVLYKTCVQKEV